MPKRIKKKPEVYGLPSIVDMVAEDTGLTKAIVREVLKSFDGTLVQILSQGDKVSIQGLFTISKVRRNARAGINPQTKRSMKIPARNAITIKAGSRLKDVA